jgi:uncharacterized protein (DUF362 family)
MIAIGILIVSNDTCRLDVSALVLLSVPNIELGVTKGNISSTAEIALQLE